MLLQRITQANHLGTNRLNGYIKKFFSNFVLSKMDGRHLTLTTRGRYLIQFNLLNIYKCLVVLNYTTIQINDVMSELLQVSNFLYIFKDFYSSSGLIDVKYHNFNNEFVF